MKNYMKLFLFLMIASSLLLTACGSSDFSNNSDAPSNLSYSTISAVYTQYEVIADNIPTVTGTVTSWSVSPELPSGLTLNTVTGVISGIPDTEQEALEYIITASGSGGSTTAVVSITVNLAAPTALSYSTTSAVYTIDEVIANNTPTVTGTVTSWSVSPELPSGLTLNTATGVISGTPDTEQAATEYIITANNAYGSAEIIISITVNFEAPTALTYSTTSAVYTKDTVISNNTPTVTGTVTSWEVSPELPSGLTLNTTTGAISGTPSTEQVATEYTITASNSGGSTTAVVSITVNLAAPTALCYSTTSAVYTIGAVISNNTPTVTGSVASWSVSPELPNGLTLNTTTGVISGTPDTEQVAAEYTVTATNSGGSTTTVVSITVNYEAPTALTYSTTSAVYTKDTVISNNTPTVTGSVASWSVSPELPSGLTLNTTTGVISGTPDTEQVAAEYTVTATNSGGSTTAVVSITVNLAAPTALTYSAASAVYTKDAVISNNTPTVTGSVASWSVSPELPSGLTLNTTTGVISGTPDTEQVAAEYTVTATNSGGSTTAVISITVNLAAPTGLSYTTTFPVYTKGEVITENVPIVTGTVTLWRLQEGWGEFPSGLTLNPTTGVISGTPDTVQSQEQYVIEAINSGGSTVTAVSITVNPAAPSGLSYSTPSAIYTKDAVINSNTPTVTGTVNSWSVDPALPGGLTLNTTTGVISGTPNTIQPATNYTITATNIGGSTTTNISIEITLEPTGLSYSTSSAVYRVNEPIQDNIPTVSGAITSWMISPALPSGLSLNASTGVISGTPDSVQLETPYTITASNSEGSTSTTISLTITHRVGQTFGGGIIFYLDSSGQQGLVAAPADYEAIWGTDGYNIVGAGGRTIGTGPQNTIDIVNGDPLSNTAADLCANLVLNGYNDWFLPSRDELNAMYQHRTEIGGFSTEYYWSSSEYDSDYPYVQYFYNGDQTQYLFFKHASLLVRPARIVKFLPPEELSYQTSSAVYTIDEPITDNIPSVTGTVTSWSVSPELPSGLTLDSITGAISGTPDVEQVATEYTVTADNGYGETTTTISITVNLKPPTALSYSTHLAKYTKDVPITNNVPTVSGIATSWSVNPSLPSGLSLDPTTGVISGTPNEVQSLKDYTITANNSGGSITTVISIFVSLYYIGQNCEGGVVFYIDSSGEHGLVAAPASSEVGASWGSYGTLIGTGNSIGSGQSNTTNIVTWLNNNSETGKAAQYCDNLSIDDNGVTYNDWFLPSKDELNLMYTELHQNELGGFKDASYSTSSEVDSEIAWRQNFLNGVQYNYNDKNTSFWVRAVRAF